jgi:hypothetical protein
LTQIVETSIGSEYQVSMEFVDHIPTAPDGKLQFVVPLARSPGLESAAA